MFSSENPYEELATLRRRGRVVPYRSRDGTESFFVTRHSDIAAVLADSTTYTTSFLSDALAPVVGDSAMVGLDGDRHRDQRLVLANVFASSASRTAHASTLQQIADEFVGSVIARGSGDLIADVALPFPGRFMAASLGLASTDSHRLQTLSVEMLSTARAGTRDDSLLTELTTHLVPAIREARRHPRGDVLSHLVQADVAGQPLTDEGVCTLVGFLLMAGLETFHRAIGNLLYALLTCADQLEAVRADPTLRGPAIEEALRWEAPVILTVRTARVASGLAGSEIPAGSLLYLLLGSANRDDHQHPEPDRYDVLRDPKPHLSFGHGVHACPGASLARTGLRVLLDAVLDGARRIELDPANARPAIRGELFRSPDSMPVTCDAATSFRPRD